MSRTDFSIDVYVVSSWIEWEIPSSDNIVSDHILQILSLQLVNNEFETAPL